MLHFEILADATESVDAVGGGGRGGSGGGGGRGGRGRRRSEDVLNSVTTESASSSQVYVNA